MALNRDLLYKGVVQNLERYLGDPTAYNVVKCSGLLRQLLCDSPSLIDVVKKGRGAKIAFRATVHRLPPVLSGMTTHFANPAGLPGTPASSYREYSHGEFLGLYCGQSHGESFTVKDLIRFGAHVHGGIHSGTPRDPADFLVEEMDNALQIGELTTSMHALEGIGQVTLVGLLPLTAAIR
jgi:hypothetical protein